MSAVALDQVIELALKLTVSEQAKLLKRIAAHIAREVETPQNQSLVESLADQVYEVWSPQDEGGTVAALNPSLTEY